MQYGCHHLGSGFGAGYQGLPNHRFSLEECPYVAAIPSPCPVVV